MRIVLILVVVAGLCENALAQSTRPTAVTSPSEVEIAQKREVLRQKQLQFKKLEEEITLLSIAVGAQDLISVNARCLQVVNWKAFVSAVKPAQADKQQSNRRRESDGPMFKIEGGELMLAWQVIDKEKQNALEALLVRGQANQFASHHLTIGSGRFASCTAGTTLPPFQNISELEKALHKLQPGKPVDGVAIAPVGSTLTLTPTLAGLGKIELEFKVRGATRVQFDKPIIFPDGSKLPSIEETHTRGRSLGLCLGDVLLICSDAGRNESPLIWLVSCEISEPRQPRNELLPPTPLPRPGVRFELKK